MKNALVELSVPDLHFLIAIIGNVDAIGYIPDVLQAGSQLQYDGGVIGLFKKIATAHDAVCPERKFTPVVKILEEMVNAPDDVEWPTDDDVLEAGESAELLRAAREAMRRQSRDN